MPVDTCVSRVEVSIEARNLRDMDVFGVSDPFAILYTRVDSGRPANDTFGSRKSSRGAFNQAAVDHGWVETFRTETIDNTLNPSFVKSHEMAYFFERHQELRVELYDRDAQSDARLNKHDYLGGAEFTLAELVAAPGQRQNRPLRNDRNPRSKPQGEVTLLVEEVAGLKRAVSLDLAVAKLRTGLPIGGTASHFLRISRAREGPHSQVDWLVVYKTKPTKKASAGVFHFRPFEISSSKLNNGDVSRPLRIELFAYAVGGSHKLRGVVETSEVALLALVDPTTGNKSPGAKPLQLRLPGKTKETAELVVNRAASRPIPTFLDYIFGGCEIALLTAIDFTASNGDPRKPGTLHYNDPSGPNEYESAITAVTHILGPYDSDQMIPAFGYGAKLPPNLSLSHCFALNGNPQDPDCHGPEGVMTAYRQALNSVTLSGPTIFSQIMSLASSLADKNITQDAQAYTILLIITDGIIADLEHTVQEIVRASNLPLSIVIVGVGAADFSAMEQLDADDAPLISSSGERMKRDIVQFVPFRRFQSAPALLAEEVLAEIPDQMLSYMHSHGIQPNPRREAIQIPSEVANAPDTGTGNPEGQYEHSVAHPQEDVDPVTSHVADQHLPEEERYPEYPTMRNPPTA